MYDHGAGDALGGNSVGNIRVLEQVHSPELDNRRDIHVYLPPSYAASGRHYPVLYMHDGQNLFDHELSFAGEWGVDETLERIAHEGVEAIVVGIPNMGGERTDEYSPYVDDQRGGGRGELYVRFLTDTLRPLVDARFRTRREPEHTGLAGSSMGGLISLYAFLRRPDVFGFAGVMSPSLWFAHGAVFGEVHHMRAWTGRLYLDTGTGEGRAQVRQTREMVRILRRKARQPRLQLHYVEDRGAGHHEAAWAGRFERAIRWLLPKKPDLHW